MFNKLFSVSIYSYDSTFVFSEVFFPELAIKARLMMSAASAVRGAQDTLDGGGILLLCDFEKFFLTKDLSDQPVAAATPCS